MQPSNVSLWPVQAAPSRSGVRANLPPAATSPAPTPPKGPEIMSRIVLALLAGLTLFAAAPARAADKPVGSWKMSGTPLRMTCNFLIAC